MFEMFLNKFLSIPKLNNKTPEQYFLIYFYKCLPFVQDFVGLD